VSLNWRRLRQEGFLTVAIVLGSAVLLSMVMPLLDLRGSLIALAVLALLIGWIP
jgi:hypothetical protein